MILLLYQWFKRVYVIQNYIINIERKVIIQRET